MPIASVTTRLPKDQAKKTDSATNALADPPPTKSPTNQTNSVAAKTNSPVAGTNTAKADKKSNESAKPIEVVFVLEGERVKTAPVKLGISDEMVDNLRTQMQNVDLEEYLNTARDYLKSSSAKAKTFTKENPGKVAAGVAVLAVGAGLLISALNRD